MKHPFWFAVLAIALLAGCRTATQPISDAEKSTTSRPPQTPESKPAHPEARLRGEHLALEIINPRPDYDNTGGYVTTVYLIRNISDKNLTIDGGPVYQWHTTSGSGSVRSDTTLPTPRSTQFSLGFVKLLSLEPGQAAAFVGENKFGPAPGYAMQATFYRGDAMGFETPEKAQGLKYQVLFQISYGFPITENNELKIVNKTEYFLSPEVKILPE